MRTYDTGAGTHGTNPTLRSIKGTLLRWLNRERELISLRNAVGMMSEARKADAAEYDDMVEALRKVRTVRGAPLTDEQIYGMYSEPSSDAEMLEFARAIEAAHGIKPAPGCLRSGNGQSTANLT